MLDVLSEYDNLVEAAKDCAGNWQRWNSFVWFGADDYPKSENIMLGYTVGPQSDIADEANHLTVERVLAPYLGMHKDPTKTADRYGASVSGDQNAAKGFMVRVYDDNGHITKAFAALFDLSREYIEGVAVNEKDLDAANHSQMLRYVTRDLADVCKEVGVEYKEEQIVPVTEALLEKWGADEIGFEEFDADFANVVREINGLPTVEAEDEDEEE